MPAVRLGADRSGHQTARVAHAVVMGSNPGEDPTNSASSADDIEACLHRIWRSRAPDPASKLALGARPRLRADRHRRQLREEWLLRGRGRGEGHGLGARSEVVAGRGPASALQGGRAARTRQGTRCPRRRCCPASARALGSVLALGRAAVRTLWCTCQSRADGVAGALRLAVGRARSGAFRFVAGGRL